MWEFLLAASHFQCLLALIEQPWYLSAQSAIFASTAQKFVSTCGEIPVVGVLPFALAWGASSWCVLFNTFGQEVLGCSLDGFQAIHRNILVTRRACALVFNLEHRNSE
jgi:hypothetical protein